MLMYTILFTFPDNPKYRLYGTLYEAYVELFSA